MRQNFFFESALLPGGWCRGFAIEARDGLIERVSENVAPEPGDQHEALVVPGLPNLHSHAFQRAMAGLSERRGPSGADDFWTWRKTMYGFLEQLEADDIEAIAAYAYMDMLEAGFTSVAEFHYLHRTPQGTLYENPAELALRHLAAAHSTGIGVTVLPVFYEAGNFGGAPPASGQLRFVTDLEIFADIVERVRAHAASSLGQNIGIGLHSLRAVTGPHIAHLLRQYPASHIHIHAAEQLGEVNDCVAFTGLRPVEWLLRNTDMNDRWCIVHATHLSAAETMGLAHTGAVAGLCPMTEANLGDGTFPGIAYRDAAGRWGIGSDSNVSLDAAGELRQLNTASAWPLGRAIASPRRISHRPAAHCMWRRFAVARRRSASPWAALSAAIGLIFSCLMKHIPTLSGAPVMQCSIPGFSRAPVHSSDASSRRVTRSSRADDTATANASLRNTCGSWPD